MAAVFDPPGAVLRRLVQVAEALASVVVVDIDPIAAGTVTRFARDAGDGAEFPLLFSGRVVAGQTWAVSLDKTETEPIPYEGVPVGTIKKHATGKGNASKAAMVEAARLMIGTYGDLTEDEADAVCLLDYAVEQYGDVGAVCGVAR